MTFTEELVRNLYVPFLRSKQFDHYFRKLHPPPRIRIIIAILLIPTLTGIPISIGLILSAIRRNHERKQARERLIQTALRSQVVMAYPMMVNSALLTTKDTVAPGLVIVSFDPSTTIEQMAELIDRMETRTGEKISIQSRHAVNDLYKNTRFIPNRRRRIPDELTGTAIIYACDLMILADFLPTETLEYPLIPCLAEAGDQGTIQMLPYWLVATSLEVTDWRQALATAPTGG